MGLYDPKLLGALVDVFNVKPGDFLLTEAKGGEHEGDSEVVGVVLLDQGEELPGYYCFSLLDRIEQNGGFYL